MCQYCSAYGEVLGNATDINQIAPIIHKTFVIPGILSTYLLSFLLLLIVGRISIKNNQGFLKFFMIWFTALMIIGFFVILMLVKPSIISGIVDLFTINK